MAYSIKKRKQVVNSYLNGEGSIRELGARYEVNFNTVMRWVKQYRDQGHLNHYHHRSGPKFKLDKAKRRAALLSIVEKNRGVTLTEVATLFLQMTGEPISTSGVRTELLKMNLNHRFKP